MIHADRILVVDDEAVIRELMLDILNEEGYDVEVASSGPEALAVLRERDEFVLLLTDIMMPDMNGIELIREARKVRHELIPIVMTGFATLDTARAAVKEGAYDYILKPFSLSEIKMAVANAIDRHRLANENARLRNLTELFHISETIAGIHEERKLLNFVLKAALDHVNAERGSLMLTTPDGKALEVAASVNIPEEGTKDLVRMGTRISGWVAQNVTPLLVEDLEQNPELAGMSRRISGDSSFISVPLQRKSTESDRFGRRASLPNVIAVLNVSKKKGGGSFSEGDLKTLSIVANHAAAALENARLIKDVERTHMATLQSMALLLEAKDTYTHGHSQRVCDYSVLLALKLGMNEQDVDALRIGAAFHDIGKVGVADAVLNKAEKLTQDEWEMIKRHPMIGFSILEPVQFLGEKQLQLVRGHHERLDGSGYPDGLTGDQISPLVRIIALADAYDAMSSNRAYRQAMPHDKIIAELKRFRGAYDPAFTDLIVEMIQSGEIVQGLKA